jgi:hypothetical protein
VIQSLLAWKRTIYVLLWRMPRFPVQTPRIRLSLHYHLSASRAVTADLMCSASMAAAASNSFGVPDPGCSRTFRWTMRDDPGTARE